MYVAKIDSALTAVSLETLSFHQNLKAAATPGHQRPKHPSMVAASSHQ